jgi:RNA polymerase sigma-70 factor (ECF subfamily)
MAVDDSVLIEKIKAGERGAFDLLVDRYYRMVYGISLRMMGNAADADEVAHDAFVNAYLKLSQLNDPERFGGWVKTLTLNLCRMRHRYKRRLAEVELRDDVAETKRADDEYARIYTGISKLSSAHRLVLALHYFEGLSYGEIARFLGVPNGTVMSRLSRARNLLKEELQNMNDDNETQPIADLRFKEGIQAEAGLLLSMKPCKPGVGMRLRSLFEKSPERFVRLLIESDDETVLHNIAVILPRLEVGSMRNLLAASASDNEGLMRQAKAVLRKYMERCVPESVPGGEHDTASLDAYVLVDQVAQVQAQDSTKARIIYFCAECCRDSATRVLLMNALLCYPDEAFRLLMDGFRSGSAFGSKFARHVLVRFGNRFAVEVERLLSCGDRRLGLIGLDTIARSMAHPWIDGDSSERFVNELRVAEKYPPIRRGEIDPDLLRRMTRIVAEMVRDLDGEIRRLSIAVLGHLKAEESKEEIRECLSHEDSSTRVAAIRALAEMEDVSIRETLVSIASLGETEERCAAITALGQMGADDSVLFLWTLAEGEDGILRDSAISALGAIGSSDAESVLKGLLTFGKQDVRKSAAKALYGGVKRLEPVLSDVDRKLAEKRRRVSQPISFISMDAAIRYALTELRPYEERELTQRIACICEDYCAARRYLVERGLMTRAEGTYRFTSMGESVWRVEHLIMEMTEVRG